jgi:hypothetical protein
MVGCSCFCRRLNCEQDLEDRRGASYHKSANSIDLRGCLARQEGSSLPVKQLNPNFLSPKSTKQLRATGGAIDYRVGAPAPAHWLIRDELLHGRMPQHALGFEVPYPHPQFSSH